MSRKAKPKKTRPRTKRQKKLVEAILTKGRSFSEAAKEAGYANRHSAHEAFTALKLRFHPALEAAGYDLNQIVTDNFSRMLALRDAKIVKHFAHQGIVMETKEVEDNATRRLAIRDTNEFLGIVGSGRPADEDRDTGYVGPAQVSVTLVIADPGRAKTIVELSPDRPTDHQQPFVDEPMDQDPGRPRSEPSL